MADSEWLDRLDAPYPDDPQEEYDAAVEQWQSCREDAPEWRWVQPQKPNSGRPWRRFTVQRNEIANQSARWSATISWDSKRQAFIGSVHKQRLGRQADRERTRCAFALTPCKVSGDKWFEFQPYGDLRSALCAVEEWLIVRRDPATWHTSDRLLDPQRALVLSRAREL